MQYVIRPRTAEYPDYCGCRADRGRPASVGDEVVILPSAPAPRSASDRHTPDGHWPPYPPQRHLLADDVGRLPVVT